MFMWINSVSNINLYFILSCIDSTTAKLKMCVTGVLGNAHMTVLTFIDCCQWPHDSNLTINLLLRMLILFQER